MLKVSSPYALFNTNNQTIAIAYKKSYNNNNNNNNKSQKNQGRFPRISNAWAELWTLNKLGSEE